LQACWDSTPYHQLDSSRRQLQVSSSLP
jgi:hypothetical protein